MTLIYFISLKHEYNLERSEYNLMFNSFNPLLFDYFTYLYGLSINEGNIILITKCICVILKILIKSIAIEPPIAFVNTINDYLQFYYNNINNNVVISQIDTEYFTETVYDTAQGIIITNSSKLNYYD
jgi:hypothetical protein